MNKTQIFHLQNGLIIDGSGLKKKFKGDLYIKNGKIIPTPTPDTNYKRNKKITTIDCKGKIIAPGFIDIHTHSDEGLFHDRYLYSSVTQGVTTEIVGNCGWGFVPPSKKSLIGYTLRTTKEFGFTWSNYKEYKEKILLPGVSLNLGLLVGHNNLRSVVLGKDKTSASSKDIKKMCDILANCFNDGAIGISTGLAYYSSQFSTTNELIQLAKVCKKHNKIFTFHMRDEGVGLCDSISEVINIAKITKCRVQISHFKTSGRASWPLIDQAFKLIRNARNKGIKIHADRYPYLSGVTGLLRDVPYHYYKEGFDHFLEKITCDYKFRLQIQQEMNVGNETNYFKKIICADFREREYHHYRGLSLYEIAKKRFTSTKNILSICNIWNLFWELVIKNRADVLCFFFTMCEKNLKKILKEDYVSIGSDKGLSTLQGAPSFQLPHPRYYGTYPRFLGRYIGKHKLLSLEEGIYKCSGLPAKIFNIKKRGILKKGNFADVVVFDPKKFIDQATYKNPKRYTTGVEYLFVNGEMVIDQGKHSGELPGVILG
ncbi:MAG: amidohydrolase family protein [Oligoflexia bacterium]|nr:amidohydrolase family protein [Oligoflexia bacterium]